MASALVELSTKLAVKFGVQDQNELLSTLKATAFKGPATDAQMTALLIVADQYGLNPWTREIYAFPDRNNGIVPVVGVDGWSRIINENPQFDGVEFHQADDSCTCTIYRKDRGHPIKVTEFLSECIRDTGPWKSHPRRMLRHKSFIQCSRMAFGFVGIYDHDEAERIAEAKLVNPESAVSVAEQARAEAKEVDLRPEAIATLKSVAETGDMAELAKAWASVGPDMRKAIGASEWQSIKDLCDRKAIQRTGPEHDRTEP